MNKYWYGLVLWGIGLPGALWAGPVQDWLSAGLSESPAYQASLQELRGMSARVRDSGSGLWPQINLRGDVYQGQTSVVSRYVQTGLALDWSVLNFQTGPGLEAAASQLEIASVNAGLARQSVLQAMVSAWLDYQDLAAQYAVKIRYKTEYETYVTRLSGLVEQRRVGLVDKALAVSRLQSLRAELLRLENALLDQKDQLAQYSNNVPPDTAALTLEVPASILVTAADPAARPFSIPELRAAALDQKNWEKTLERDRAMALPALQLSTTWMLHNTYAPDRFDSRYSALATLSLPVFDGGHIAATLDRDLAELASARIRHSDTVSRKQRAVRKCQRDYHLAARLVPLYTEALAQAKIVRESSEAAYQSGQLTFYALSQSHQDYVNAELQLAQAATELKKAQLQLLQVWGLLDIRSIRE